MTGNPVLDKLPPLDRAARVAGGFAELARQISHPAHPISRQQVHKWRIAGHVPAPKRSTDPDMRKRIAKASGGAVRWQELEDFEPGAA